MNKYEIETAVEEILADIEEKGENSEYSVELRKMWDTLLRKNSSVAPALNNMEEHSKKYGDYLLIKIKKCNEALKKNDVSLTQAVLLGDTNKITYLEVLNRNIGLLRKLLVENFETLIFNNLK